jgi:hypothetical protein
LRVFLALGTRSALTHISDHDLERYYLGMLADEAELAVIEEHLTGCSQCIDAAEEAADESGLRCAIHLRRGS